MKTKLFLVLLIVLLLATLTTLTAQRKVTTDKLQVTSLKNSETVGVDKKGNFISKKFPKVFDPDEYTYYYEEDVLTGWADLETGEVEKMTYNYITSTSSNVTTTEVYMGSIDISKVNAKKQTDYQIYCTVNYDGSITSECHTSHEIQFHKGEVINITELVLSIVREYGGVNYSNLGDAFNNGIFQEQGFFAMACLSATTTDPECDAEHPLFFDWKIILPSSSEVMNDRIERIDNMLAAPQGIYSGSGKVGNNTIISTEEGEIRLKDEAFMLNFKEPNVPKPEQLTVKVTSGSISSQIVKHYVGKFTMTQYLHTSRYFDYRFMGEHNYNYYKFFFGKDDHNDITLLAKTENFILTNTEKEEEEMLKVSASDGLTTISTLLRLKPMSQPTNANKGTIYFDETDNKLKCYDGTTWHDLY